MKKVISLLYMIAIIMSLVLTTVYAEDNITVFLNNKKLEFDVQPQIIDDYTMVPMRTIFESLGYEVTWNEEKQVIYAQDNDDVIAMVVGRSYLFIGKMSEYNSTVNKNEYFEKHITQITKSPQIIEGRTFVPLRIVSEASGYKVSWDQKEKIVRIGLTDEDVEIIEVSYYDATREIEQISSFIEQGLYLEAIECCEQTLAWHELSFYDISLLKGLKVSSEERYNNYKMFLFKKVLNGQWYNGEQEWASRYGFTFSDNNTVKYEGYRIHYNGTYSILKDSEVLLHFDDNKALWAGPNTETLAGVDVVCKYNYDTKTLTATLEKIYDTNEVYFEDGIFKRDTDLVYDDITTEVNQIRSYISRGLYVEAMQLSEIAKESNDLTLEDKNLLTELYWDANKRYSDYLEQQREKNLSKIVTDYQKRVMYSTIKTYVSSRLKSAATAIWPSYNNQVYRYNEEGVIIATGTLEAMNSFGGYGKVYYTFRFNGDLSVDYWYVN